MTTEDRRENRRIDADPAGSIVVSHLRKDYGRIRAVDDLSFSAEPGTGAPSPPRSAQS